MVENRLRKITLLMLVSVFTVMLLFSSPAHIRSIYAQKPEPVHTGDLYIANDVLEVEIYEDGIYDFAYPPGNWHWPWSCFAIWYDGLSDALWQYDYSDVEVEFPEEGVPDAWYSAVLIYDSLRVTKSVYVPPGTDKYFLVTYDIENIGGDTLSNVRFFQYGDFGIDGSWEDDTAVYDPTYDFIYVYETTYVGFKGYLIFSTHHDVDEYSSVWERVNAGTLIDTNSYGPADIDSALEYELGDLAPDQLKSLTIVFAFGDSLSDLESTLLLFAAPSCEFYVGSAGGVDFYTDKAAYLPGETVWIKASNTDPNHIADFYLQICYPDGSLAYETHVTIPPGGESYRYFTETTTVGWYPVKAFNVICGAIPVGSFFVIPESMLGTLTVPLLGLIALNMRKIRRFMRNRRTNALRS
jgi:hypothetical protein